MALVLSVLVHNTLARQVIDQARREADRNLEEALANYAIGDPPMARTITKPTELPHALQEVVQAGCRATMVGTHHDQPVMWAAAPTGTTTLAIWQDYTSVQGTIRELDRTITAAALLASAAIALAGALSASRISSRLRTTATVAQCITAGDLSARVNPHHPQSPSLGLHRNEVHAVAHALDSMAWALQKRLESERRFTADVAHELRTPLTGLITSASLLPDGRPKEMITDRLHELHRLTEDLLEISRLDAHAEKPDMAHHDLAELVQRCVRGTGLEGSTQITVENTAPILTDRRRLDRILANLVINAHRHGAPPIHITVNSPCVSIQDHGPGYPPDLLAHGPRRFCTKSASPARGHGLGLTIVLGQAHVIGATVTFANTPNVGAHTTITLNSDTPTTQNTGL
ncbi:sensor histidine kinase [Streptomyces murinus]|uniref:sensor histidine kinase n=1 Tax=Streptomyces murinus TaxID=33900 RepID=UPI0037FEE416